MPLARGDEVCALINGLGSTTILEMSIAYRKLAGLLEAEGIKIYDADINSYCTCMEMGGFSISLLKLDAELKKLYDAPCYCPFYAKEGR
jgi:dihydroxyacetone kinase-like protein